MRTHISVAGFSLALVGILSTAVFAQAPAAPSTPASDAPAAPQADPLPVPTLVHTIGMDFVTFPKRRSTWVILGIGAGGALLAHPADGSLNSHLAGSGTAGHLFAPGKWIGSTQVQVATSVGLYVVGRYVISHREGQPRTNRVSHLGYDLLRAQVVSQTLVQGIKFAARRERPNGGARSFPSGHSATAFAVAAVLERHLGYRASLPGLAIATYVATSRLHDNVHFLSDVVFGSALGMATGWTVVGRHGRSNYALVPAPVRGGLAVMLTRVGPRSGRL